MSRHHAAAEGQQKGRSGAPYPPADRATCIHCGEEKPALYFSRAPRKLNGLASACRECGRKRYRANKKAVPRSEIAARRFERQGDQETADYVRILAGDPCGYCLTTTAGTASIDHIEPSFHGGADHWTNLGAACVNCNVHKARESLLISLLWRNGYSQLVPGWANS